MNTPWLTSEQYEKFNHFAPEILGFLLLVMDSNIATAKNIYSAQRIDLNRTTDRIVALQQEVDELRLQVRHLLEEVQALRLEKR